MECTAQQAPLLILKSLLRMRHAVCPRSLSLHHSTCTIAYFEGFAQNAPYSLSLQSLHHSTCTIACLEGFAQNAPCSLSPQWGTADSEIKVPSVENPELTNVSHRFPLKAWCRSEYSHACFAYYCFNFCLPSPFSIIFLLFQILSLLFTCVGFSSSSLPCWPEE